MIKYAVKTPKLNVFFFLLSVFLLVCMNHCVLTFNNLSDQIRRHLDVLCVAFIKL